MPKAISQGTSKLFSRVSPMGFIGGLSLFTNFLIVLLAAFKKLVDLVLEKLRWEIFRFKMNLYLRLKVTSPLMNRAGDSTLRRFFAYLIILAVFSFIFGTMAISIKTSLSANSNIVFVVNILKTKFAVALQENIKESSLDEGSQPADWPEVNFKQDGKYIATLPIADDVKIVKRY